MARLIVHVEGATEEEFVGALLAPHLLAHGWAQVVAYRMGRARSRERRHGVKGWDVALAGILHHLRGDPGCCVTTLVDYYGLPSTGPRAWPGRAEANAQPFAVRGRFVQEAMLSDVARELGGAFPARRFIPFVVMHEFEGLLFSDPEQFGEGIGRPDLAPRLRAIREAFNYWYAKQLHIVASGSFGAAPADRPESTPRLYNLLEIARDFSSIRVHTRCQPKPDGPWGGWYEWPDPKNDHGRVAYYDIKW